MNHFRASQQLTAFLDGSLDDAGRSGVQEHLAGCGECRDWVNAYRLLAGSAGSAGSAGTSAAASASIHLSSDELSTFALAAQTLDTPVRERCSRHLQDCFECGEEIALVRAAAAEARADEPTSIEVPVASATSLLPLAWAAGLMLVAGVVFLGRAGTEAPASRQLSDLTVSGATTVNSLDSILVQTTSVETGAELNLSAGNSVAFGDGFSVDSGGSLSVEVNGNHGS